MRLSFGRAAARYDQYADLQRRAGLALLQRLDIAPDDIRLVLDVGSGTGYFLPRLANRFPRARLVAVDLAEEMLEVGRGRWPGPRRFAGMPRPCRSPRVAPTWLIPTWPCNGAVRCNGP
ncbi:methyltransferase domain-containing protein [Methylogaea oryzae]|uniref:methyltransferase domain-containing protein n=1 Tax=Methylogaea oryzae TaxID=1295382 RepID=UPI001C3F1C7E|nr:methyltransferase domain-containing protein [Methylogaea oryzae]